VPALSPLATPVLTPLAIRTGASPITVNVTSSNTKVLVVKTPQVVLKPGDQQALVQLQGAPGQAALTLSGATYDFATSQSSLVVTVQ